MCILINFWRDQINYYIYRGPDGWMASLTQWTWVWAGSRRQWRTGKPGMLQSMGHKESDTTDRQNWKKYIKWFNSVFFMFIGYYIWLNILGMAILTCMRQYFIVVLICISLIISNDERFWMCLLALCISSLEKYLFRSSHHFSIGLLFLFVIKL